MSKQCTLPATRVHRGVLSIEIVIILAVLAIAGITIFLNSSGLFSKNETSTEMANAQQLTVNTRSLLKTGGVYNFNGASDMTGLLIKFDGAPKAMSVVGDASSGTATLINVWGGGVTIEPTASSGGKTGFTLTYGNVPLAACTVIASQMSSSYGETSINGSTTVGTVSAATAGSQCTKDNGSTGTNALKFTSMT